MAEYIEREALLSELQEEIDFETSMYTEEQNQYFSAGLRCAYRDVKSQPTADVVPKSEVIATVEKLMSATDKVICEAKAEVAREIFEGLDKFIVTRVIDNLYGQSYDITDKYKELKKKYLEDEE